MINNNIGTIVSWVVALKKAFASNLEKSDSLCGRYIYIYIYTPTSVVRSIPQCGSGWQRGLHFAQQHVCRVP